LSGVNEYSPSWGDHLKAMRAGLRKWTRATEWVEDIGAKSEVNKLETSLDIGNLPGQEAG
jgi:hypothetical protein